MNLHEYQAKELLEKYGLPIPSFRVAKNKEEVLQAIQDMQLESGVVKAQVHAGGRGKAGGVKFGKSSQEIQDAASAILGMKIVNRQTGPEGVVCHQVMICDPVDIEGEYYLGFVIDRHRAEPMLILSSAGGMEIEQIAATTPEKILQVPYQREGNLTEEQLLQMVTFMGWDGNLAEQGRDFLQKFAGAALDLDASMLEINPLVATKDQKLYALDAKLEVDDNALFRHTDIQGMFDETQTPPQEVEAEKAGLSYVKLDGDIGCMVNGAGLAMATMDIIKFFGGEPANFLDVGGSATAEMVAKGFQIILQDPHVKAILVNIFGGIMKCDVIAEGIILAAKKDQIEIPLIVRLEGTRVEEGKKLLKESSLNIAVADDLRDAASQAVTLAKRGA